MGCLWAFPGCFLANTAAGLGVETEIGNQCSVPEAPPVFGSLILKGGGGADGLGLGGVGSVWENRKGVAAHLRGSLRGPCGFGGGGIFAFPSVEASPGWGRSGAQKAGARSAA